MAPFAFFLAGLAAAYIANRLILRLTEFEDEPESDADAAEGEAKESLAVKRLPWQTGAGPDRVRYGILAFVPVLCALAGWRFDPLQAAVVSVLLVALLVCTATDLLRYRVPNAVTYPGTALAILAALVMPGADAKGALIAALLGGFVFLVMAILTRGGLGLGDVKLAVLIGAALGFPAAYQALTLGIIVGGVAIAALFLAGVVGRRQAVPYAPFLALAAVAVVLIRGASFAPL